MTTPDEAERLVEALTPCPPDADRLRFKRRKCLSMHPTLHIPCTRADAHPGKHHAHSFGAECLAVW